MCKKKPVILEREGVSFGILQCCLKIAVMNSEKQVSKSVPLFYYKGPEASVFPIFSLYLKPVFCLSPKVPHSFLWFCAVLVSLWQKQRGLPGHVFALNSMVYSEIWDLLSAAFPHRCCSWAWLAFLSLWVHCWDHIPLVLTWNCDFSLGTKLPAAGLDVV